MNTIIKNFLMFFFAVVFAKAIGTLSTFFYAKFLPPADYGIWITLMLIYTFSPIICLGTMETLVKQYPFFMGLGSGDKAVKVERGVWASILLSGGVLLAAGLLAPILYPKPFFTNDYHIMLIALATVEGHLAYFFYYRFIAHQDFKTVSVLDAVRSVSTFVFVALGAWLKGLSGAIAGFCINEFILLSLSYLFNKRKIGTIKPDFHFGGLVQLVKIGFPITVIWWFYMVETSIDRMLSMKMLGKEATGFYGLGGSLVSVLSMIPMAIGKVLYPRMNEEVGKNTHGEALKRFVLQPTRFLTIVVSLLIGILVLSAPVLYFRILPKYQTGLLSAQLLLVGAFFICQITNNVNYLVAINKQNRVVYFIVASLCCNVLLCFVFVRAGLYIEGIALATVLSGIMLTTMVLLSVFKNLKLSAGEQVREMISLYAPITITACFVYLENLCFPVVMSGDYLFASLGIAAFIAVFSGIMFTVPPLSAWTRELTALALQTVIKRKIARYPGQAS